MGAEQFQLSLIAESIILPKAGLAQFTPHGLSISPAATEGDLLAIAKRFFAIRSYTKWALGSVFAAMIEKRDATPPRDQPGYLDGGGWLSELTDAHELDPKERREMLGVYTFYRGCKDTPPLSFDHYRDAMWGVSDGKPSALHRALAFLRHAHTHTLTPSQLRKHIRVTQSTNTPEPDEPQQQEMANYAAVFDFMRFAKRELSCVGQYTPERAALVLSDIGDDTIRYIDALREIASKVEE